MRDCWIGIGGNLGNSREFFDAAWSELSLQPELQLGRRSGIYHTTPVGQAAGATYTNAVFSICTSLLPIELLTRLQAVEIALGRKRTVRWGSRPIDLDILFADQLVLDEPRLTIPHPAAWYRRFVIDPLHEVSPTLHHPVLRQTVAELKARLSIRPLIIASLDMPAPLSTVAAERFLDARIVTGEHAAHAVIGFQLTGTPPATILGGVPIADLTSTPGDANQRLTDFLTSVFDEPRRVGDW